MTSERFASALHPKAVKERSKLSDDVPHGAEIVYFLNTGDVYEGTKSIFITRTASLPGA